MNQPFLTFLQELFPTHLDLRELWLEVEVEMVPLSLVK